MPVRTKWWYSTLKRTDVYYCCWRWGMCVTMNMWDPWKILWNLLYFSFARATQVLWGCQSIESGDLSERERERESEWERERADPAAGMNNWPSLPPPHKYQYSTKVLECQSLWIAATRLWPPDRQTGCCTSNPLCILTTDGSKGGTWRVWYYLRGTTTKYRISMKRRLTTRCKTN